MSERRDIPEPTELVYLPKPSWLPAFLAVGIALIVVGLFAWYPYAVVGALIAIPVLAIWLGGNRDSIARMPREQHPVPAALTRRR